MSQLTTIRTWSRQMIDILDPDPSKICIEDIAHSLSQLCRFNGHTDKHYSVAQHCVLMSELKMIPDNLRMAALLHDASEAYLGDVVRPVKILLPYYQEIEEKFQAIIAEAFSIQFPFPQIIHEADEYMLKAELKLYFDGGTGTCWSQQAAVALYINKYFELARL